MLDLKLIREDPERVRKALERRRADASVVDELLELDARRRQLLPELEGLRSEQKRAGEAIAEAKRAGDDAAEAIEEMQGVASRVKEMQAEVADVEERIEAAGDINSLDRREQILLARRVVLREIGTMTIGAILIVTLALRAASTGGGF